ncbi:uncharacterized protein [Primulina eburnea]|uniref:uncharacterized protein isoform X1 n=1 Tax=Primulina eburnea TaxID=1245227 RepID=UPI003C6C3716
MASAASAEAPRSSSCLKVEALKCIDITRLSQLELQALSLCSASSFDLRSTDDVVCPQLDRSLFNESAGSRRQTYSRLLHRSHFRLPGPHPSLKPPRDSYPSSDPVNHSIIHYLKHFMNGNHNPPPPAPPPAPPHAEAMLSVTEGTKRPVFQGLQENLRIKLHAAEKKRKRAIKDNNLNRKGFLESGVGGELQKVNNKGEVVNFEELEKNGDELFAQELRSRTAGLVTEEDVLGFLWSLEGQWCSTRKKRKYVDAGMFGDSLPIGWKLLLGIRRRDFRPSIYCRRYISPTGQQFLSCQEAASFLKSYFGSSDADLPRDQKTYGIQRACVESTAKNVHSDIKKGVTWHDMPPHSTLDRASSGAHENKECSKSIENLPEVQVQDAFECAKCKLTFDEKNVYLQHLFAFHQKTTKRCRIGTPVGEGVIIKDGKYECQFCHKVFEERRSYNGHVGVHVRNSGKNSSEITAPPSIQKNEKSPSQESLLPRTSKMDALVEIAQSSINNTPKFKTCEQTKKDLPPVAFNLEETPVACGSHELNLFSAPVVQEEDKVDRSAYIDLNAHGSQAMMDTDSMVINDYTSNVDIKIDDKCVNDSEYIGSCDIDKYGKSNIEMNFGNGCSNPSNDHLEDARGLTVGEIDFPSAVASVPLTQSFQFFPSLDSMSNKVEHEFSLAGQKLGNATEFEELRFDDLEPFKYGFMNGEELQSFSGSSMNLGNIAGIVDGFNSSVTFGSEDVTFNALDANQLTTVCVWCRAEFKLDSVESEAPSESIGYMCPTCKDKISGHLDGGLSMNPRGF